MLKFAVGALVTSEIDISSMAISLEKAVPVLPRKLTTIRFPANDAIDIFCWV